MSNEDVFITKSAAETRETITVDGVEYPVVKLRSLERLILLHRKNKLIDTAGRIDKFKTKYANTLNNIACFQHTAAIQRFLFYLFENVVTLSLI
jgi:large subunit ribosomal protein L31